LPVQHAGNASHTTLVPCGERRAGHVGTQGQPGRDQQQHDIALGDGDQRLPLGESHRLRSVAVVIGVVGRDHARIRILTGA